MSEAKAEIKVIKKAPTFTYGAPQEPDYGHIWGFQIGSGIISFHPEVSNLPLRNILIPVMASFGMTNTVIATKLHRSENTIKGFVKRDFDLLGIPARRRGIARHFFESGIYQLEEYGESLDLTAAEHRVLEHMSWGKTDSEIADAIAASTQEEFASATVKNHLTRIADRTGWHGMEAPFAAIVSGDIGNYALRGEAEIETPSDLVIPETRQPAQPITFLKYEGGGI